MQKRSFSRPTVIKFSPLSLDPDFPILCSKTPCLLSPPPVPHLHYHSTLELGICNSGSGIFYIGNQTLSFSQGDVSVIFPNIMHIAQSAPNDISSWHFIDIDLPRMLTLKDSESLPDENALYSGILSPQQAPLLVQTIERLKEELVGQKKYRTDAIKAWVNLIVVEILRYSEHKDIFPSVNPVSDKRLEKISPAILHITRHYQEPIQVSDLAALCHLSIAAFRRNFIAVMDMPPHEYLNRVRANMGAYLLLKSALSVADIAYEAGCASVSTFNRIFKAFYHTTPISYRISQRQ